MHIGLGEFWDYPQELHHGDCWTTSVRTTSGEYAHFVRSDGSPGPAIFPSDCIRYWCSEEGCDCQDIQDVNEVHLGRVYAVGKDFRITRMDDSIEDGDIVLKVQPLYSADTVRNACSDDTKAELDETGILDNELIMASHVEFVPVENAGCLVNLHFNYRFGENFEDPSPAVPKGKGKARAAKVFPKYSHRDELPVPDDCEFIVRRFWDTPDLDHPEEPDRLWGMSQSAPLRA